MKKTNAPYLVVEIILGIVACLCIFLLLVNDVNLFFSVLYSPYSFLVLVVVILEYIILKGMDRSRFYRLEIERLTRKRRRELAFRQHLESEIRALQKTLETQPENSKVHKRLDEILKSLKEF